MNVDILMKDKYDPKKDLCISCDKKDTCEHLKWRIIENKEKYEKVGLMSYFDVCSSYMENKARMK